jgi:hypothetical protein
VSDPARATSAPAAADPFRQRVAGLDGGDGGDPGSARLRLVVFVVQSPPDLAALFAVGVLAGIVGASEARRLWPSPSKPNSHAAVA